MDKPSKPNKPDKLKVHTDKTCKGYELVGGDGNSSSVMYVSDELIDAMGDKLVEWLLPQLQRRLDAARQFRAVAKQDEQRETL